MTSLNNALGFNLSVDSLAPPLVSAGVALFIQPMIQDVIKKAFPNLHMNDAVGWLINAAILAFAIWIGQSVSAALLG